MPRHLDLGKKGEELAVEWLTGNGYTILDRNWRHGRHEIDIIASQGSVIHFIEVKCRTSSHYGHPEESVNRKKISHILQAASGWLYRYPGHNRVQYDVLAITLTPTPSYLLFADISG